MGILELLFALIFGVLTVVQAAIAVAGGLGRRVVAATPGYLLIGGIATIVAVGLGSLAVPILVVIKVVTGWSWAAYAAAVVAVILTGFLALLWTPLALFIGAVLHPLHPVRAGQRYVRSVAVILFAELMFALGLLVVPFHNNYGAIPAFLLTGTAVVLAGLLWGGVVGPRFFRAVAVVALILVTASFFLPQTSRAVSESAGNMDGAIAAAVRGESSSNQKTLAVGSRDEVEVPLSPNSWFLVSPDKPIFIRLRSDEVFKQLPDGRLSKRQSDGSWKDVSNVGDFIPGGVIFLKAANAKEMARVTISSVRK